MPVPDNTSSNASASRLSTPAGSRADNVQRASDQWHDLGLASETRPEPLKEFSARWIDDAPIVALRADCRLRDLQPPPVRAKPAPSVALAPTPPPLRRRFEPIQPVTPLAPPQSKYLAKLQAEIGSEPTPVELLRTEQATPLPAATFVAVASTTPPIPALPRFDVATVLGSVAASIALSQGHASAVPPPLPIAEPTAHEAPAPAHQMSAPPRLPAQLSAGTALPEAVEAIRPSSPPAPADARPSATIIPLVRPPQRSIRLSAMASAAALFIGGVVAVPPFGPDGSHSGVAAWNVHGIQLPSTFASPIARLREPPEIPAPSIETAALALETSAVTAMLQTLAANGAVGPAPIIAPSASLIDAEELSLVTAGAVPPASDLAQPQTAYSSIVTGALPSAPEPRTYGSIALAAAIVATAAAEGQPTAPKLVAPPVLLRAPEAGSDQLPPAEPKTAVPKAAPAPTAKAPERKTKPAATVEIEPEPPRARAIAQKQAVQVRQTPVKAAAAPSEPVAAKPRKIRKDVSEPSPPTRPVRLRKADTEPAPQSAPAARVQRAVQTQSPNRDWSQRRAWTVGFFER